MTAAELNRIRNGVAKNSPLIHCITNPISINQCANAVLGVGARPMMAEHPMEVAEITSTAKAVLLNLGNITDARMESMLISAETARERSIPCVIDAVGTACSNHRREYACMLIERAKPAVIKGNYSEINSLYNQSYRSEGVDADTSLNTADISNAAEYLAKKHNTVILASGKTDIVTDGKIAVYVKNGCVQLSHITGTGCMLGALCACYLSEENSVKAVVAACGMLGICGELAQTEKGNGSFLVGLMDRLSTLSERELEKYLDTERK